MLTILVPTYNRQDNLNRIFNYYANSNFKVIVADGSASPLSKLQISTLAPNITYYHGEELDLTLRIKKILHLIDTPYACLLADDELHLLTALQECIKFLDSHKDYSTCIGLPIGFKNSPSAQDICIKSIYPEFKSHAVNQDLPQDRIDYHFNSYTSCSIWSVQRTLFLKIALEASHIKSSCVYVPEIAFELANAVLGKLHILQKVSWLRNYNNPPITNKNWNRKFRFHHWYTDSKYLNEKNFWLDELCKLLYPHTKLSMDNLKSSIEYALNVYVEKLPQNKPHKFKIILSKTKNFIKYILKIDKQPQTIFEGSSLAKARGDLIESNYIINLKDFDDAFNVIKKYSGL